MAPPIPNRTGGGDRCHAKCSSQASESDTLLYRYATKYRVYNMGWCYRQSIYWGVVWKGIVWPITPVSHLHACFMLYEKCVMNNDDQERTGS